jgi:hypothetical protein
VKKGTWAIGSVESEKPWSILEQNSEEATELRTVRKTSRKRGIRYSNGRISIMNPEEKTQLLSLIIQLLLMVDFGGVVTICYGKPIRQVMPSTYHG